LVLLRNQYILAEKEVESRFDESK